MATDGYPVESMSLRERKRTLDSSTLSVGMHTEIEIAPNVFGDIRHNLIDQNLKLIDTSLRVLGLLPWVPTKPTCLSYLLFMYHVSVWVTSLSMFIARFASYHFRLAQRQDLSIGVAVAILVTLHVISLKICIIVYVALKFARKRRRIFDLWEEYKLTHGGDWEEALKKRVFWTFLICWGFTLGYCVMVWIVYFISDSSRSFQKVWVVFSPLPIIPDGFIADVLTLCYHVLYICHPTAMVYMVLGVFFILITDITQDFKEMTKEFEQTLDASDPSEVHYTLYTFHKKHQILTDFLHEVDDLFSPMVLSVFVCGIFVICFAIYTTVLGPSSDQLYCIISITVPVAVFFMTLMITLAVLGAQLSHVAYGCRNLLFDLDCQKLVSSDMFILEYISFMSRLNSESLNITGWKLFLVNKSSINSMVMIIATYTVLILKMDFGP